MVEVIIVKVTVGTEVGHQLWGLDCIWSLRVIIGRKPGGSDCLVMEANRPGVRGFRHGSMCCLTPPSSAPLPTTLASLSFFVYVLTFLLVQNLVCLILFPLLFNKKCCLFVIII